MNTGSAPSRARWFLRLSLRARLMIIGLTGLVIALTAGSLALYAALTIAINRTLDNDSRANAAAVQALLDRGDPPDPLPVSGAQIIQIVDAQHRVVNGSITADRLTPLLHLDELQQALSGAAITVPGNRAGLSGPLRVIAETAGPAADPVTILVGQQVSDVIRSADLLRTALLFSSLLLVAVLGVIAWYAIGRTLRPVEALRRGAERISGSGRADRLPVPPSTDEIAALAVTLNRMLDRLAAARGRQRAFVADAAHELRSPLTNIRIQLEVAQRTGHDEQLIGDVLTDVERLSALVEDLLLLARADADTRGPAHPTVFDGRELLTEIAASRTSTGGIDVEVETGEASVVRADRTEMSRAIGNLVDNAVRHARRTVLLRVKIEQGSVVFEVVDDGPGIAAADRERVFERFTRLDEARARDAGGSGLGLSIVAELAERAGGSITLAAAVPGAADEGVSAQLRLPAHSG